MKDTSIEINYKFSQTHSSVDATIAKILVEMSKAKIGGVSESRKKKRLRKEGVHVRHNVRDVNPSVEEVAVDSPRENQDDDDIVVVSSTTSRRRTRAIAAAPEKKRAALGAWGDADDSTEPDEAMDLEELERLVEKKKASKKSKGKAKRPSNDDLKGEVSGGEDIASAVRRQSKGKMKVNDDRNRINNRRIAKGVEDMSIDMSIGGVHFNSKENEARWNFVCARNILPERYLSEATMKNQTCMEIIEESGMLAISGDIGPH
ncbi:hypothetical protein LIER_26083 [Lithospermum erythrorhizon]|uniref:Uncharacterized protein n=1 Tax=Lithospermum erythrorhizon TaxID=34254 RepID=A0AAV3RBE8_LITER